MKITGSSGFKTFLEFPEKKNKQTEKAELNFNFRLM